MKRERGSKIQSKTQGTGFESEFHASIDGRKPGFYVLENLAPCYAANGNDVLFYRLRFTEEGGFPHGNYEFDIQLTRINNPNSKKRARDEFEEEAFDTSERINFQVKFPTILHEKVKRATVMGLGGKMDTFLLLPNYQVHMNGEHRVKAIYFTLEDNQIDERIKDQPLWNMGLDESAYWMPRAFGTRYRSLEFMHPDPTVPCDKPPHKRPQRSANWMSRRVTLPEGKAKGKAKVRQHQSALKGRIGGTKSTKFAGFFKNSGLEGTQGSSPMMKLGRMCEMEGVITYLTHYKNRIVEEVGWFDHPNKPYHGASPDGLVTIPGRTFEDYPGWVLELISHSKADMSRVNPELMVLEIKVSQTSCDFKAHYVAQLYQEMIVTNTYCAELVKMCLSTGEIRVYRVYRNPVFESLFSECLDRVENLLLAGKAYLDVVDHPINKNLRSECIKLAMYYNGDTYSPDIIGIPREVEDYKAWKAAFAPGATKRKFEGRIPPNPPQKRTKVAKGEDPQYMESELWKSMKMKTVAINAHLKTGDRQAILDANLIEDLIDEYQMLSKRLRRE